MKNRRVSPFPVLLSLETVPLLHKQTWTTFIWDEGNPTFNPYQSSGVNEVIVPNSQCTNWHANEPAESAWFLCLTTSQNLLKLMKNNR